MLFGFIYTYSLVIVLVLRIFLCFFDLVLVICVLLIHHYSPKQFSQYSIPNLKRSSQSKKKNKLQTSEISPKISTKPLIL